jgi:hypothetical protein
MIKNNGDKVMKKLIMLSLALASISSINAGSSNIKVLQGQCCASPKSVSVSEYCFKNAKRVFNENFTSSTVSPSHCANYKGPFLKECSMDPKTKVYFCSSDPMVVECPMNCNPPSGDGGSLPLGPSLAN